MDFAMRYHKDIGFPRGMRRPRGKVNLTYTPHALEQCMERKTPKLKCITLDRFDVIEITVNEGRVQKYFLRGGLNESHDILLSVAPGRDSWRVITTWTNEKNDHHKTLDYTLYERP